jgi:8-oxo-dGTP pyrophosphatase MutT (NUDIX family)
LKERQKALCCIQRGAAFLFTVRHDGEPPATDFLIPPGGGIEEGEAPREAATREVREELGWDITDWNYLRAVVDEFTFRGDTCRETGHILVAQVPERAHTPDYAHESNGAKHPLTWLTVDELRTSRLPIYPPGLLEELTRHVGIF